MTAATVHDMHAMTEADYERERERIAGLLRGNEASAYADQELAALFTRSGWTQERLAAKEGKSQFWVLSRVRFGRFLAFISTAINPEFAAILPKLTEGKFRRYWLATNDTDNDRQRFLAVRDALLADLSLSKSHTPKPKEIGRAIAELADGKVWHREATIVAHAQKHCAALTPPVPVTEADVQSVLLGMLQRQTHGVTGERRKGATGWSYRLVRVGRTLDYDRLLLEAGPILDALQEEGMKSRATMSPPTVARLAFDLRQLFERLAGTTDEPRRRAVPPPRETENG